MILIWPVFFSFIESLDSSLAKPSEKEQVGSKDAAEDLYPTMKLEKIHKSSLKSPMFSSQDA